MNTTTLTADSLGARVSSVKTRTNRKARHVGLLCLCSASLLLGCGDDTYTPDACGPIAEYDVRELYAEENEDDSRIAEQRARVERAVENAADKGCVTEPRFTPRLSDVNRNSRRGLELELDVEASPTENDDGVASDAP